MLLPNVTDETLQAAHLEHAYRQGWTAATARYATAVAELEPSWAYVGRVLYANNLAARVRQMERCAADLAAQLGRPAGYEYRGGPVDWDTGHPAPTALVGAAA